MNTVSSAYPPLASSGGSTESIVMGWVIVAVIGIAAITLGATQFFGPAGSIAFFASLVVGAAFTSISIGALIFTVCSLKQETSPHMTPSSPPVHGEARQEEHEVPPPDSTASQQVQRGYGYMEHATNFCYAASSLTMLFLSTDFFYNGLLEKLSSPQLKENQRTFLGHLANQVVIPLREGKQIPKKTMEECQRLSWEAGWKPDDGVAGKGDVRCFLEFLLDGVGVPKFHNPYLVSPNEAYHLSPADNYMVGIGELNGVYPESTKDSLKWSLDFLLWGLYKLMDKQKYILDGPPILKEREAIKEKGVLHFDQGLIFSMIAGIKELKRIDEKIAICDVISSDIFGERIKTQFAQHSLVLRSILVSSSVHSYTFLKMEGSWIKHDDLAPSNQNYILEQVTDEIRRQADRVFFLYDRVTEKG